VYARAPMDAYTRVACNVSMCNVSIYRCNRKKRCKKRYSHIISNGTVSVRARTRCGLRYWARWRHAASRLRSAALPCSHCFGHWLQSWLQSLLCCGITQSCSLLGDRQELPKEPIRSSTARLPRRERLVRRSVLWVACGAGQAR
jgi:hypothetical protein